MADLNQFLAQGGTKILPDFNSMAVYKSSVDTVFGYESYYYSANRVGNFSSGVDIFNEQIMSLNGKFLVKMTRVELIQKCSSGVNPARDTYGRLRVVADGEVIFDQNCTIRPDTSSTAEDVTILELTGSYVDVLDSFLIEESLTIHAWISGSQYPDSRPRKVNTDIVYFALK